MGQGLNRFELLAQGRIKFTKATKTACQRGFDGDESCAGLRNVVGSWNRRREK